MHLSTHQPLLQDALDVAISATPGQFDYEELAALADGSVPALEPAAEGNLPPATVRAALMQAMGGAPHRFFVQLRRSGALRLWFPEVDALFGVPQPEHHHPEIDTGVHCMMVLAMAERLTSKPCWRFAALTHDLGKARTPSDLLPRHHGHEGRGVAPLLAVCRRYKLPVSWKNCAELTVLWHTHCHRALELRPMTLLRLIRRFGAERHPARLEGYLLACEADSRGRPGFESAPYPQAQYLREAANLVRSLRENQPSVQRSAEREKLQKTQVRALQQYRLQRAPQPQQGVQ